LKKTGTLILVIVISIILSVIYGITHDFITSKISPEFYTKLTFFNFGILDDYSRNLAEIGLLLWFGLVFSQLGGLVF